MSQVHIAGEIERSALVQYLERLVALDNRAVVRLQAGGNALGVWSGPPFEVVALKPVALAEGSSVDATVSAQRLLESASTSLAVALPSTVPGPTWVGLLPPRSGWRESVVGDVAAVRAAVDNAKHFFRQRADGVSDRERLESIAADVWERACLGEVPVRAGHAADSLGLLGPSDGRVVAFATDAWLRLAAPGGSVAVRRGLLPKLPFFPLT